MEQQQESTLSAAEVTTRIPAPEVVEWALAMSANATVSVDDRRRLVARLQESMRDLAAWAVEDGAGWSSFCERMELIPRFATRWSAIREKVEKERKRRAGEEFAGQPSEGGLRRIMVDGRQGIDVINEAWDAVSEFSDEASPRVYIRGGVLSRVDIIGDEASIVACDSAMVQAVLMRSAEWWKASTKGSSGVEPCAPPPKFIAEDMIASPRDTTPEIDGIATSPCFAPGGLLMTGGGYHVEGRTYLHNPVPVPSVGMHDSDAVALLWRWLEDFPFARDSDRCHALALFLLPFVRPMISGPTPVHLIEAASQGSGKTLLGQVLVMGATGRLPAMRSLGGEEEERRKALMTALLSGRQVVFFDNVSMRIASPSLEGAVTASSWTDRILGATAERTVPVKSVWVFTTNNAQMSDDMLRRTIRIRIVKPAGEVSYHHPDILGWTREHHPKLVEAAVTLVRRWVLDGKPRPRATLGSFEEWAAVVGGVLERVGIPGFLEDRDSFRASAVADSDEWSELVDRWVLWAKDNGMFLTSSGVVALTTSVESCGSMNRDAILQGDLARCTTHEQRAQKVGALLSERNERYIGDWQLLRATKDSRRGWILRHKDEV